ncbi:MAG: AI-2E family transporter [Dehalococcoidia bacterium]|nr:AI-2E family transporter [Dehalococcoidia bacterium]
MASESATFRKVWISVLVILGIALVLWLGWISLPVLIPFLVGILLAYLLFPLVSWLERILPPKGKRKGSKRVIAVIIVFVLFTLLLIAFIVYIGAAIVSASTALVSKAPEFVDKGMEQVNQWMTVIQTTVPPNTLATVKESITNAGPAIAKFVQDFVVGSIAVIPSSMPTILGFITLPFFLIFVLLNYERYGKYFNEIFPARVARHSTKMLTIFGTQMGRYIRFMIIMAAIEGTLVTLGLFIVGMEYALAMGAVAAFTQVIPIIGPFISAAVILLVTLALKPQAMLMVFIVLVVAYLVVMALQGLVQEKHFPLDPGVVMVLMTVGGFIGSYWGIILALPVGATVWQIYKYFRDESKAEKLKTEQT